MNAAANDVTINAVCADVLDLDDGVVSGAGLVTVADAFYQPDLAAKMMRFLHRQRARGAEVLVGDFGRAFLARDQLIPLASYDVPGQRMMEGTDIMHTTVWMLRG